MNLQNIHPKNQKPSTDYVSKNYKSAFNKPKNEKAGSSIDKPAFQYRKE